MRVILVDDEPLALNHLEKLVGEIQGLKIIGKFNNPQKALEAVLRERPEIVFLDIEMPEINGIQIAERIHNNCPETNIVFVTAYNEYAVKAFELNAIDYVIKPIQRKRLEETVRRVMVKSPSSNDMDNHSGVVCCFKTLRFKRSMDDPDIIEVHWRTSKARELFSFLLQHRQNPVRKDVLLDLLWPEFDESKGLAQLYAAIYQIRKTLKKININITISSIENSYMLELNDTLIDVDEWERGMEELSVVKGDNLPQFRSLLSLSLYIGDYLSEEGYLWAESERERLRILWLHYIKDLADFFISKEKYTDAILLYQRVQILHPYVDSSYFILMKLYDLIGDRHSVTQQYNNLRNMLKDEYDINPNDVIEDWYENWKKKQKRAEIFLEKK